MVLRNAFYAMQLCKRVLATIKPSVRPSVIRLYCEKIKESSAEILTPYERALLFRRSHEMSWDG